MCKVLISALGGKSSRLINVYKNLFPICNSKLHSTLNSVFANLYPRPQNVTRLIFSLKKYHQGYSAIVAMVAGMLTNRISDRQTDRKPVCSLLCNLLIEHP